MLPYNPYDPIRTGTDQYGRQGYDPYRPQAVDSSSGAGLRRRLLGGAYTGEVGSNSLPAGVYSRAGLRRKLQMEEEGSAQGRQAPISDPQY